MKLVLVESPNKCQTIKKYLGDDYEVIASLGHVRDLAICGKDGLGVDCEKNFEPTYRLIKAKRETINKIKGAAKKADEVILATDPDREGEAIAWHLKELLNLKDNNKRLEFHEITRSSITDAIHHPRVIDMNLVYSQEARRIIDRILGFRLSELIQQRDNLLRSAGRVQSATLKLIVDHEKEIKNFVPKEFWSITAKLKKDNVEVEAPLYKYLDKEVKLNNKAEADEVVKATSSPLKIVEINKTVRTINPKPPFTTSTLQQEAISRLGMSAARVSRIAQELYEGISVHGEHVGLITYIRTDSTYLSDTYVKHATNYIKERFGEEYVAPPKANKSNGVLSQNAHEAIRPTGNHRTPTSIRQYLNNNQYRLYELIYNRALAYLMTSKKEESTAVIFGNDKVKYKINANKTIYKGYEVLTGESGNKNLPFEPHEGDEFEVSNIDSKQNFTTPPARFTEAKVIRLMEERGIGRPSTYSSTLTTLSNRMYVEKNKGILTPTPNGIKAIEFLDDKFANLVNSDYTKELEEELDKISIGSSTKLDVINNFYQNFMKDYTVVLKEKLGNCPECGAPLVRIKGPYGSFTGCSNYPNCKYKVKSEKKEAEKLDRNCPMCGAPLVKRISKKGKPFVACSAFPTCKFIEGKNLEEKKVEIIKKCPDCKDGNLVVRRTYRKGKGYVNFLGCTNFPKCRHIEEYNSDPNDVNKDE